MAIPASLFPVKKYHLDMFPVSWPTKLDQNITRPILHT